MPPTSNASIDAYINAHPAPGTIAPPPSTGAVTNPITSTAQASQAGAYDAQNGAGSFARQNPTSLGPAAITGVNTASSAKVSTPVINAQAAATDYQTKLQAFMKLNADILAQSDAKAKAQLQSQEAASAKALQDSETTAKQQGIDIQKIQAEAQKTAADAKLAAANGLTSPSTTPGTPAPATTTNPTSGTSTSSDTTNTNGAPAGDNSSALITQEASAVSNIQNEKQDAFENYKSQVSSIMNGTFPLSPSEQALITATQASFDRQKADQAQANASYEGTVREASFRNGGEYTPEIMAGQIQEAVSSGVSKIAALDAQAAKTTADLQQGFMQQDYQMVNDLYDKLDKQLTDKSNSIKDLFDTAIANEKDIRNYNLDVQKFTESTNEFAISTAQNAQQFAVSSDQKQQEIDETKRQNAFDRAFKTESLALEQRAADLGDSGGGSPVSMGPDGKPDAAQQAAFLATLPPATAQMVKDLTAYRTLPSNLPSRVGAGQTQSQRQILIGLAHQYDPTYDDTQATTRQALVKNLQSGQMGQSIVSLNTAISHLGSLDSSLSQVGNTFSPLLNKVSNVVASVTGLGISVNPFAPKLTPNLIGTPGIDLTPGLVPAKNGAIAKAGIDITAVSGELASALKKTGATDTEIGQLTKGLSVNMSPTQQKAWIEGAVDLLNGRINGIVDNFTSIMGHGPDQQILSSDSLKALGSLKDKGYNITVPGVFFTDISAFKNADPDANSKLTNAFNSLKSLGIPTTPENILQAAQQE